jgi:hypothetical protein
LWPNVSADVRYESTTPGKMETMFLPEPSLNATTNKTMSTAVPSNVKQRQTALPPTIKWDDEAEYPMLDELSRIAKVCLCFVECQARLDTMII